MRNIPVLFRANFGRVKLTSSPLKKGARGIFKGHGNIDEIPPPPFFKGGGFLPDIEEWTAY